MEWTGLVLGGLWAQEAPVLFLGLLSLGNAGGAPSRLVRTQKPRLWLCPVVYLSILASFSSYKERRGALTILPASVCELPHALSGSQPGSAFAVQRFRLMRLRR